MPSANPTTTVEYRLVIGFPLYRVGDDGSVWSRFFHKGWKWIITEQWRSLGVYRHPAGYVLVRLRTGIGEKPMPQPVHRIVLEAFVGPRPEGMVCRHLDGNRDNNNLSNLRWGTPKDNSNDSIEHGSILKGSTQPNSKLTEDDIPIIRQFAQSGITHTEIGRRFGISRVEISGIVRRERWKHIP